MSDSEQKPTVDDVAEQVVGEPVDEQAQDEPAAQVVDATGQPVEAGPDGVVELVDDEDAAEHDAHSVTFAGAHEESDDPSGVVDDVDEDGDEPDRADGA